MKSRGRSCYGSAARLFAQVEGSVISIAFSPDGKYLASSRGVGGDSVTFWDLQTGAAFLTLTELGDPAYDMAFSGDGEAFVTANWDDRTATLWSFPEGERLGMFRHFGGRNVGGPEPGRPLSLYGRGGNGRAGAGTSSTGQIDRTYSGATDSLETVVFNRDGTLLASAGGDGAVVLWRVSDMHPLARLEGSPGAVQEVAISPDSELIASTYDQHGYVRLWSPEGKLLNLLSHGEEDTFWRPARGQRARLQPRR